MAKTKVHGNRISDGAIESRHLSNDFKISEKHIEFNLKPHEHTNKAVLDTLKNSIPQTLLSLDLKDIMYTIIEVSDARDANKTLKQTLDNKSNIEQVMNIEEELEDAKRGYSTLNESITALQSDIDRELAQHIGAVGHQELDGIYAEIRAARGLSTSLKDRIDQIAISGGGGSGSINVISLTPWSLDFTLEAGKTVIDLPNSYVVGNSTLQVFDGPVLLQSGVDYKEVSPLKIEMLEAFSVPLQLRIIGVNSGRLFEWERRVSGNGSISRIELSDSYRPGGRELQVYEDGLLLREDEDYIESSPHVITFNNPIPVGSLVTIYKRRN